MSFWIYANEKPQDTHFYYFTKKFEAKAGDTLTANVCADTRYQLYFNDNLVCEGPCQGPEGIKYYESADLSPYLKDGENTIFVKVLYMKEGYFTTVYRRSRPALWFDGRLTGDGSSKVIGTDESWECVRDDSVIFNHGTGLHGSMPPFEEWLGEGALSPVEVCKWYEPNTQNKGVNVWGIVELYPLNPRIIPQMELHPRKEMTAVKSGAGFVDYDTGEYTTAKVYFRIKSPRGTVVKLIYSECYSYADAKGTYGQTKRRRDAYDDVDSGLVGPCDIIHGNGEEQIFSPFWYRAFRFIRAELPEGAEISVSYSPYFYPLDNAGSFECSDEAYNKMWHISRNTLLCCMHEMYVDCPHYEQAQYEMDSTLEMLYTFRMGSDKLMPLKSLTDLAHSQISDGMMQANYPSSRVQIIPNFSLFWVLMARDYIRYTADVKSVRKFLGTIDKLFEGFEELITEEGLIGPTPYWPFVDWVPGWERGVPSGGRTAPLTVTCLMYATALKAAAEICEAAGRTARANEYKSRADMIIANVNRLCYDEEAGLYRNTPERREFSQHTTVWAVLSGAVTGEDAGELVDRTFNSEYKISKCTFSMNHYLFRALEKANRYNYAQAVLEGWHTMLDWHCTTWCENPDAPRSECHAWSAAPAYEFSAMALGVYPTGDGYSSVRIRPNVKDLGISWAKGCVPTPFGVIAVDWKIYGDTFTMNVTLPENSDMITSIELPDGSGFNMTKSAESFSCKL